MKKNLYYKAAAMGSLATLFGFPALGQMGIGTLTPDPSAQLDVSATNRGLLVPRLTTTQRNAIVSPANSLMVYDITTQSFWYYRTGTGWLPLSGSAFSLPYAATSNNSGPLFTIENIGDGAALYGKNASVNASISAIIGEVTSTSPGGFSTGVRGINNGSSGLGIGVWGSQGGSGWGVYGVTPSGLGVYGNSSGNGFGVYANSNSGTGLFATSVNGTGAQINNSNASNSNPALSVMNIGPGNAVNVSSSSGNGIVSTSGPNFGLHGLTSSVSGAGVVGDNGSGGEAVVGRTISNIAGAVVGRNDGGGYGVKGFIGTDVSGNAAGVYGEVGNSGSMGRAGMFKNLNSSNTIANAFEVSTNGLGNISNTDKGNAAYFVVDNTNSVAAAVRGEVNTIFGNWGAAAIMGVAKGTGGFAGLFHSPNTAGSGTTLVAINAGNGDAIRASSTNGNGMESSTDGTGKAIVGYVPSFGAGQVAQLVNYNTANAQTVLTVESYGTGNLAVFKSGSPSLNRARISNTGRGYFNGGTQNSGADIAEAFDVLGNDIENYEPGDVLIVSTGADRTVEKSNKPYSALVLGVYATRPGVLLTEEHIDTDISDKVPMGVVGVIPTKVCLEGGKIQRGDLLVTSSQKGVAMRANPKKIKPGQIIGKALQPYEGNGIGKINVFVNVK